MLTEYINAAMATAEFEQLEDQPELFGRIPPCQGVWAIGMTEDACREELRSVLEDWIIIKLHFGDQLPAVAGIRILTPATAVA